MASGNRPGVKLRFGDLELEISEAVAVRLLTGSGALLMGGAGVAVLRHLGLA